MKIDSTFSLLPSETEKSGEEKEKEHHSLEFNASFTPTVAKIFTRALAEKRSTRRSTKRSAEDGSYIVSVY